MSQREFYERWHRRTPPRQDLLATRERQGFLAGIVAAETRGRTLLVGCGAHGEMGIVPVSRRAFGVDLSLVAVERSRHRHPGFDYAAADGGRLPFAGGSFETLVCSEVLEHLEAPGRFLGECRRVLAPGGTLVLTTPNWISLFGLARWIGRVVLRRDFTSAGQPVDRWSTRSSLQRMLLEAGLSPRRWLGFWFLPPLGKGRWRPPDGLAEPLLEALLPIDRRLRSRLPGLGHVLCVIAIRTP